MGKFIQITDMTRLIVQQRDGFWSYVRLAALDDEGNVWGYTAEEQTKHTVYPAGWHLVPDGRNPISRCKHG